MGASRNQNGVTFSVTKRSYRQCGIISWMFSCWLSCLQVVTMVTTTRGALNDIAVFRVYVRPVAPRADNRQVRLPRLW